MNIILVTFFYKLQVEFSHSVHTVIACAYRRGVMVKYLDISNTHLNTGK